jgi:aromatic ring-opening dioxygenase catalytic subunit (LigB family)
MVFRTWDLNFGAWEILRYGFQDMVFKTWDLNFGAWEILGHGFQDLGSQLWGLDFHIRSFQDRNLKTFRT